MVGWPHSGLIQGRVLVFPQLNVPGFVDSPRVAISFGRSRRRVGWWDRGGEGEQKEEWKGELRLECKMNDNKGKERIV